MPRGSIFHPDYQPRPYWWEAYAPTAGELVEVPREARVAIVGGGYAGLAGALEVGKDGGGRGWRWWGARVQAARASWIRRRVGSGWGWCRGAGLGSAPRPGTAARCRAA